MMRDTRHRFSARKEIALTFQTVTAPGLGPEPEIVPQSVISRQLANPSSLA